MLSDVRQVLSWDWHVRRPSGIGVPQDVVSEPGWL